MYFLAALLGPTGGGGEIESVYSPAQDGAGAGWQSAGGWQHTAGLVATVVMQVKAKHSVPQPQSARLPLVFLNLLLVGLLTQGSLHSVASPLSPPCSTCFSSRPRSSSPTLFPPSSADSPTALCVPLCFPQKATTL